MSRAGCRAGGQESGARLPHPEAPGEAARREAELRVPAAALAVGLQLAAAGVAEEEPEGRATGAFWFSYGPAARFHPAAPRGSRACSFSGKKNPPAETAAGRGGAPGAVAEALDDLLADVLLVIVHRRALEVQPQLQATEGVGARGKKDSMTRSAPPPPQIADPHLTCAGPGPCARLERPLLGRAARDRVLVVLAAVGPRVEGEPVVGLDDVLPGDEAAGGGEADFPGPLEVDALVGAPPASQEVCVPRRVRQLVRISERQPHPRRPR